MDFFSFLRKRRLTHAQLQTLQMVAQQVVLSLEGSVKLPGAAKKALALRLVAELSEDFVRLLRTLEAERPQVPEVQLQFESRVW